MTQDLDQQVFDQHRNLLFSVAYRVLGTAAVDFSHAEIAEAVDRSEAAVRQAAHRAREHVRARRPRFTADRSRQREVTERFFAAATGGDVNALMELLSPDVTLWTDGGGKVRQALRPVVGASTVAAWFAALGTVSYQGVEPADMTAELVEINGGPGVVFSGPGRVIATVTFDFDADGRITAIHNVANPDKLGAIADGTAHDLGTRSAPRHEARPSAEGRPRRRWIEFRSPRSAVIVMLDNKERCGWQRSGAGVVRPPRRARRSWRPRRRSSPSAGRTGSGCGRWPRRSA
ncbi:hypothetical protein GCM10023196_085160 [Actinoallomurus vinaceus]|uniref:RNA polymerase sigma factor 70 region 4 type 2 domain-containing protein n=1 Tax=Actinoallomurus vinaceus TaxID=1080074 RepID=A0ABP8UNJ7_9ACTN